jgi:hypothetical protein
VLLSVLGHRYGHRATSLSRDVRSTCSRLYPFQDHTECVLALSRARIPQLFERGACTLSTVADVIYLV